MTFIAERVAKGNTESEAVLMLGLRPAKWFNFKNRAKRNAKYGEILTRLRGVYIAGNIRQMELAAGGLGGVRHDWRAADRLNQIIAPERFGPRDQAPGTTNNTQITVQIGGDAEVRRLVGLYAAEAAKLAGQTQGQAIDVTPQAQIKGPTQRPTDQHDK